MVSSGRRPVLALLSADQVPFVGAIPAMEGLADGIRHALRLAVYHAPADVYGFDDALNRVRRSDEFDINFCRAFAAGYSATASEVRRIGGIQ